VEQNGCSPFLLTVPFSISFLIDGQRHSLILWRGVALARTIFLSVPLLNLVSGNHGLDFLLNGVALAGAFLFSVPLSILNLSGNEWGNAKRYRQEHQ
jgi:hypothetical protein